MNTCQCDACKDRPHSSDCAVHNGPALPAGKCDCRGKDSMVERVARAIAENYDGCADPAVTPSNWARAVSAAHVAIEAMMEPTKAMVFYGMDAMSRDDLEPTEDEFRRGYQGALRHALRAALHPAD